MKKRIRRGVAFLILLCLFVLSIRWVLDTSTHATLSLISGNVTSPAIVLPSALPPSNDFASVVSAPIATMSASRVSLRTNGHCTYTAYADDETLGTILIKRLRMPDYLQNFVNVHAKIYPTLRALSSKVKPGWTFLVPCPESMAVSIEKPTSSKEAQSCVYSKDPQHAYLFTVSGNVGELPGAKVTLRTSKQVLGERTADEKGAVCFSDIQDRITGVEVTYGTFTASGSLSHMPNHHHFPLRLTIIRDEHRFKRLCAVMLITCGFGFACLLLILLKKQRIKRLQLELDAEQLALKKKKIIRKFSQQFPYQK